MGNDIKPPKGAKESSGVEALQLARLVRHAGHLGLGPDQVGLLVRAVTDGIDAILRDHAAGSKNRTGTRMVRAEQRSEPAALERPAAKTRERLELKLRQMVEGGAKWADMRQAVWQLFAKAPEPEMAARVTELAFLHGTTADLLEVFETLRPKGRQFYFLIQRELRTYLVLRIWTDERQAVLNHFLHAPEHRGELLPIERLFVFWALHASPTPEKAFGYFQEHGPALKQAVEEFGGQLGLTLSRFYWTVGKLAVDMDRDMAARAVLEQIQPGEPEYAEALHVLLGLKVERDDLGHTVFTKRLSERREWRDRIKLLYEFLADARRLGGIQDRTRPALNELLKDPLSWVPGIPEAWAQVAQLLLDHADLEHLLPEIFSAFRDNALKFYPHKLDLAFWQPVLDSQSRDAARDDYWRGVAYLHHFLASSGKSEEFLWEALEHVGRAAETWPRPLPFDWTTLHRGATHWVAKTPVLNERHRTAMLRQLKIATSADHLMGNDIADYLRDATAPNVAVLTKLCQVVRTRKLGTVERRIIEKRAELTHFTNADLDRLWQISCQSGEFDLAWRVATVIHTRGRLIEKAKLPWAVSGEKRNEYSLIPPRLEHVERAVSELKGEELRFVRALIKVGPHLTELLAILDDGARAYRPTPPQPGTAEYQADQLIASVPWLGVPKRHFRFSYEGATTGLCPIPPFVQVLPNNTWSHLFVRLADRLSLGSWNWSATRLAGALTGLIPRLATGQEGRYSSKVAKWVRSLASEERNAWYDVAAVAAKLDEARMIDVLGLLIARTSLLINQNHFQALVSLRSMRVPVAMIWRLEVWLLSEEYTKIRQQLGTASRVPVPQALAALPTIIS